jgi:hypothetical protein
MPTQPSGPGFGNRNSALLGPTCADAFNAQVSDLFTCTFDHAAGDQMKGDLGLYSHKCAFFLLIRAGEEFVSLTHGKQENGTMHGRAHPQVVEANTPQLIDSVREGLFFYELISFCLEPHDSDHHPEPFGRGRESHTVFRGNV